MVDSPQTRWVAEGEGAVEDGRPEGVLEYEQGEVADVMGREQLRRRKGEPGGKDCSTPS
jgi:hypothetical protein